MRNITKTKEDMIRERQTFLKEGTLSQWLQQQKTYSESPEAEQIVDEVIEALARDQSKSKKILARFQPK